MANVTSETIIGNIKAAREARGWSQRDLVSALRKHGSPMTQTTMSRVESLDRDLKLNELLDICRTLAIDPEDITLAPEDFKGTLERSTKTGAYEDARINLIQSCEDYETACRALKPILDKADDVVDVDWLNAGVRTSCVGIALDAYRGTAIDNWRTAEDLVNEDPLRPYVAPF